MAKAPETGAIQIAARRRNFTQIPNEIFDSKTLTLKAMGLLCWLLRLPENFTIYKSSLYKHFSKCGRDQAINAFDELIEAGYVVARRLRDDKNQFGAMEYIVHEFPVTGFQEMAPKPEFPISGEPVTGNPVTENPEHNNTILNNTINNIPLPDGKGATDLFGREVKGADKKDKVERCSNGVSLRDQFLADYSAFFEKEAGILPNIDSAAGKGCNELLKYFRQIAANKFKAKQVVPLPAQLNDSIAEIARYIWENWHKVEPFLRDKYRLIEIAANITNIVKQVKNGSAKGNQSTKQPTGGNVSGANIAAKVAGRFNLHGER